MKSSAVARLARSSLAHAGIAVLAMGAWAAFANRGHPPAQILLAALVQGLLSGAITLLLKRALEAMTQRLSGPAAFILPPTVTCVAVLAVLAGLHRLAGTPEIWTTIAVPYAVSSSYAWIYTAGLLIAARRTARKPITGAAP